MILFLILAHLSSLVSSLPSLSSLALVASEGPSFRNRARTEHVLLAAAAAAEDGERTGAEEDILLTLGIRAKVKGMRRGSLIKALNNP